MAYNAKILADSISPAGHRLTSFEVTFPRIVLAEVNTHRMLSRNSASSRAIPVEKRIAAVEADPFVPEQFGKNKKGMQHDEVLDGADAADARTMWFNVMNSAIENGRGMSKLGVHKQLANRLLEPFSWHTAVITATDWDNFEHLRVNPAAQGEFQKAAEWMMRLKRESEPHPVNYGDWHTPYVEADEGFNLEVLGEGFPANISAARCARVSYLTQDGKRDPKEDLALYDRLIGPGHLSPLEHPARPMTPSELDRFRVDRYEWAEGWVRVGTGHYCGNFNGWIQLRKLVPGEHDILGHRGVT